MRCSQFACLVAATVLVACSGDGPLGIVEQEPRASVAGLDHGYGRAPRVGLHDCSLVGLTYLASSADALATMPEGYRILQVDPDGNIVVIVDVTQCRSFTVRGRDVGGGAIFHEIILGGVESPDGEVVGWGFPATHTNPQVMGGFQEVGIPGRRARHLQATFDGVDGSVHIDNVPPFGPDLETSFDAVGELFVNPGGVPFVQHHTFGNGVRAMSWTFVEDTPYQFAPPHPVAFTGEFSLPVIAIMPLGFTGFTGFDLFVESVD